MRSFLEILFVNLYYFLSSKNYRTFCLLALRYGDKPRYKAQVISFDKNTFHVPDPKSFIWQYKEIYVDESYRFATNQSQPVIIDCGSNVGTSILYFYKNYPNASITAIEADPAIADILESNLKKNGAMNVNIVKKAVWIDNDGVSFESEGSDSGHVQVNAEASNKIPSIRLKDILQNTPRVDFLKIDIEGAENEVIPDCKDALKNVENIFLEYHGSARQEQKLDEILHVLKSNGFHVFIKTENRRKLPFINKAFDKPFDMQLNIFAYRN